MTKHEQVMALVQQHDGWDWVGIGDLEHVEAPWARP